MHPFLLTLYVIFLLWVVVFMKNSKCVEKYMDYFSVVKAVSIQDHILFSSYHSNSWWTKVITFVGSLYNLDVVLFTYPWPETNIVSFCFKYLTILVNDLIFNKKFDRVFLFFIFPFFETTTIAMHLRAAAVFAILSSAPKLLNMALNPQRLLT